MKDPFHDLHHHETGSTSHIRLISEGGSSHARSPELVCIDSIQATQNCTTEAQHTVFPAAVGPGPVLPESPVCTLPPEHAEALDRGILPPLLRQRLQLLSLPLSPAAAVSVKDPGKLWQIADETSSYSVRSIAARLAVYAELR
ncbi:hypothetical protein KOM00_17120 [Geomonas sp. Red69]|uniref:Uncharacterized protein n=1 Tax=Geomonas diazotrophica TaxID=2843197 RepID=A0ABX8JH83_9BACT|nr:MULTISPECIES: hypothetical protein [Geomonas]MBU5638450.1 hypothetical protein [Geomonas diazotrophica]QWV97356.1 hypothetical protein KP005_18760 [Geomonas nitrogeniifigens]